MTVIHTPDVNLAAYLLTIGRRKTATTVDEAGKVWFAFDASRRDKADFHSGRGTVPAVAYADNLRRLRSEVWWLTRDDDADEG